MATTLGVPTEARPGAAYRAFMSYSHAADAKLAAALQSALQGFAKPWYRLRMIRMFRDKTSLSANPGLWPAIQRALTESEWFLLMASEESAKSKWVEQEVRWWMANRSPERMLIVLTGGALEWDPTTADFDWTRTTAVGSYLAGMLRSEPLYVDLRWAKSSNELSLRHSQFRAAVLDLAAPLYDQPKDALDGEDVRQHRRSRRFAWSAGAVLVALTIIAVITSVLAIQQARIAEARRQEAENERQIALARQLAAQSESLRGERTDFLPTSLLLGAESLRRTFSLEAVQSVQKGLQLLPIRGSQIFKHDNIVNDAVLTPDARVLVTASDDGTVRVWDAITGAQRARLETGARVLDLRLSPDGKFVVSEPLESNNPGTIHVWDVAAGKLLWQFEHPTSVQAAAVSPDGSAVATAAGDGVVRIFEAADGRERLQLPHETQVSALAYSPDGGRLVTGTAGGLTRVWDLTTRREVWNRVTNGVMTVAFSPDGAHVATGGWDLHARVLTANDGSEVAQTSHTRVVTNVQFSPDSRYLAVSSDDGSARVFVARDGSSMRRITPQGGVLGFAFSTDGRLLSTIGLSSVVHLWEIESARELARVTTEAMASNVRFGPRDNTLIVASGDNTARLLAIEDAGYLNHGEQLAAATFSQSGRIAAVQRAPDAIVVSSVDGGQPPRHIRVGEPFTTLAIRDDGALLITQNTLTGKLAAWNVASGDRLWEIRRPPTGRESMRDADLSPDGRFLTLHSFDAPDADVIEAATGRTLARASHDAAVGTMTFSPDGRLLATTGDTTVKVWSTNDGGLLHRLDLQANALRAAFSPDGKLVATAGADRMARLWDVATGREVQRFVHRELVFGIAFSRQGSLLATSALDGVRVWDIATTTEVRLLEHDGGVDFLTFSPDDAYLATGSRDHSARVWHVATGREMARMTDLGEAFRVVFDEKGRFLLVQHNDASTEFWRPWLWRAEDLITEVCSRLGRSLSTAEWQRFVGNESYRPTCPTAAAVP